MGRFEQFLFDLGQLRLDRIQPVLRVAGIVGSALGKVIGYVIGTLLLILFYLFVWTVLLVYRLGLAIHARLNEDSRAEHQRRRANRLLREQIARSQGWMCYYGDMRLPATGYHIDHKTPVSDIVNYGADSEVIEDLTNLAATCPKHNLQKGDMDEEEFWEWMEEYDQESCNAKLGD